MDAVEYGIYGCQNLKDELMGRTIESAPNDIRASNWFGSVELEGDEFVVTVYKRL